MVCVYSVVWLSTIPWTVPHQAPLSMEFSRQEYWNGFSYKWSTSKKKKILKKYKKLAPGSAVNLGLCLLAAVSGEWKELPSFPQKMSGRSIVNCHWRRGILFLNMFCVIQHFPCEDAAFVSCKIILMEMRYWNFTLQLLACPLKII